MTWMKDAMALWLSPWEAARTGVKTMEIFWDSQSVIAARMPMISAAMQDPFSAHPELSAMVSEKIAAVGRSQKSVAAADRVVRKAMRANSRDFDRVSRGGFLQPFDWFAMFERNLAVMAAMAALPEAIVAPVHRRVADNARRLAAQSL